MALSQTFPPLGRGYPLPRLLCIFSASILGARKTREWKTREWKKVAPDDMGGKVGVDIGVFEQFRVSSRN